MIRITHVRVAVETLDLFHPNMHLVAERNRLFRANIGGVIIEEIKEDDNGKGGE